MSYPGGLGYGGMGQGYGVSGAPQGFAYPQPVGYGPGPAPGPRSGIAFFLNIGVAALGIVSFFLGFAPYLTVGRESKGLDGLRNSGSKDSIDFFTNLGLGAGVIGLGLLVAAALLASFGFIPRVKSNAPGVAALSIAGFLCLLFLMIGLADQILGAQLNAGVGLILVLVAAFLQSALAVAVMLIEAGVIRTGGGYYPPPGFGQQIYAAPAVHEQPTQVAYAPPTSPFGGTPPAGTTYYSPYQQP